MSSLTPHSDELKAAFPGQRAHIVPRPIVREALGRAGTSRLLVTDAGYFPDAKLHGKVRVDPISQAVVLVCAKGRGWCQTSEGRFQIDAGRVAILPPGMPHAYGADPAEPWTLWWLHIAGLDLPEVLAAAGMTARAPVRAVADSYRAVSLVSEVITLLGRDSTNATLLGAAGAAWHLLALLASESLAEDNSARAIDRVVDYLREHFTDQLSVTELAATARLSPSHFGVRFKQRTGMTVLQFQTQLRMSRARELLDFTDLTVVQVAQAIGYADAFYFSRKFKGAHGVPPVVYRQSRKG